MRLHTSSSSTSSSTPPSHLSLASLSALFLALPALVSASLDCHDVGAKGKHFDLSPLGGPHQVHWRRELTEAPGLFFNTTFTIDICNKLKWTKGGNKDEECPHGTRICGVERREVSANATEFVRAIPIAGDYKLQNGRDINAQWTLLRDSKSNHDTNMEGLRGELHGGKYPFAGKKGIDQQAIVEFICDNDRTGLEGDETDDSDKEEDDEDKVRRNDDEDGDSKKGRSLQFWKYEEEEQDKGKKVGVLRLQWRTKYACEDAKAEPGSSSGWGFFTWFIIILFLVIASYLIFGSWLNYNRYGARGWDLLPHGDTIRDVPYILKDWARRVANTLQGPGSRGGYSAV
ncbi:uncharacterized protein BDZ99DRAFT_457715 [Mytilinidion resinicola]|uniref:Autophagy-related protein 27 n=1 Tax=Mytilinidion resinicola TaxID=574789 RepID=A0A6A6Z3Y9_9PEZI|nr:uncharacterized protein BDZ99DRAFT_457715 [Mytilinidion resinicola]KAF2815750.1 hypothetical protein BDZ99DRAFT_457715 [Mytilinidion resinicola]